MDLLSYLRFKAPGLILDYDSLDKDFFSKDKIVVARTVYAMNDVKLNCAKEMNTDDENLAMALAVYLTCLDLVHTMGSRKSQAM